MSEPTSYLKYSFYVKDKANLRGFLEMLEKYTSLTWKTGAKPTKYTPWGEEDQAYLIHVNHPYTISFSTTSYSVEDITYDERVIDRRKTMFHVFMRDCVTNDTIRHEEIEADLLMYVGYGIDEPRMVVDSGVDVGRFVGGIR